MITKELTPTNHLIVKLQPGHEVEGHPAFNRVENLTDQISALRAEHQDLRSRDLRHTIGSLLGCALVVSFFVLTLVATFVLGNIPLIFLFMGLTVVGLPTWGITMSYTQPKSEDYTKIKAIEEQLRELQRQKDFLINSQSPIALNM